MNTHALEEIGSFEAKTHLARLLREAEGGKTFIIKRRGKVVARLVPPEPAGDSASEIREILAEFARIREKQKGTVNIREWIEEGRP